MCRGIHVTFEDCEHDKWPITEPCKFHATNNCPGVGYSASRAEKRKGKCWECREADAIAAGREMEFDGKKLFVPEDYEKKQSVRE
jgi:hypothetical protein